MIEFIVIILSVLPMPGGGEGSLEWVEGLSRWVDSSIWVVDWLLLYDNVLWEVWEVRLED